MNKKEIANKKRSESLKGNKNAQGKRGINTKVISVSVPTSIMNKVEVFCKENQLSKSQFYTQAAEVFLVQHTQQCMNKEKIAANLKNLSATLSELATDLTRR